MAKKNITFRIEEELIEKLNELRGNKSQNAFLVELINGFTSTSTSTSTSNSQDQNEVLAQLQVIAKAQADLQVQVQLLAKPKVVEKRVEVIIERDEDGNVLTEYIDETPEWQNRKLEPQEFYGKVTTYEKGEFDHDPLKYLDPIDEDEKPSKPKVIDEYDEPLW